MRLAATGLLAALLGSSACSPPDAVYDLADASACGPGSVDEIVDDFSDPAKASSWSTSTDPSVTVARTGGQLDITVPAGVAGTGNDYYPNTAKEPRILRGCGVSLEVADVGEKSSSVVVYLILRDTTDPTSNTDSHHLEISETNGHLLFTGGSPAQVDYDAALHRWWRIRESGGTVFFETSSDGGKWAAEAQGMTPDYVDHVRIEIGLSVHPASSAQVEAVFDNVNTVP